MKPIIITFGIIFGLLSFFSPASLFIIILICTTVFLINRLSGDNERRFILELFLIGIGIRIFLVLSMSFVSIVTGHVLDFVSSGCPYYSTPYIFSDSGYYTLRAQFTRMYWLGEQISQHAIKEYVTLSYGFSAFVYILAMLFTLFGYSPISSIFINCFLGTLTAILVYYIVKDMFNQRVARLVAVLVGFFPSMLLWSTTNLKEPSSIFMVCLMFWSLFKFKRTKKFHYLIITVLSIAFHAYIRYSYMIELLFVSISLVTLYLFVPFLYRLFKKRNIIFFLICTVGIFMLLTHKDKAKSYIDYFIQKAYINHRGVINTGGVCYKLLPEEFYELIPRQISPINFFKMFTKGWFHVMLEPLPWKIQSKTMLLSIPQIILWYFLLFFAILGAAIALRYRRGESIFLLFYYFIMTSGLAITGGNIGTLFRIRDVNTPIILIFSAVGIVNSFGHINFKLNDSKDR